MTDLTQRGSASTSAENRHFSLTERKRVVRPFSGRQEDSSLPTQSSPRGKDPPEEGTGRSSPLEPGKPRKPRTVWYDLGQLGIKIGVIVVLGVALFTLVYGLHYNLEPGMNPAVKDGDLVIFYRWDKSYEAGDLVVLTHEGETTVRRVVAVEGDTVDITKDGLMINGSLQQEREIFFETERYADGVDLPLTLGAGEIFVLGDARVDVTDSRIYGAVQAEDTQGQVMTILRRRNM